MTIRHHPVARAKQPVKPVRQSARRSAMLDPMATQRALDQPWLASAADMIALQQHFGNRAVQRLLDRSIQRKPIGDGDLDPNVSDAIQRSRGSGISLPASIRGPMEQALQSDFGGVRVHTDLQSDHLNRSVQAKAFTIGGDIYFRKGNYNPSSAGGRELLAHELTHVVQQGGSGNRIQGKLTLGPAGDRYEQEADRVTKRVMRTRLTLPSSDRRASRSIRRTPGSRLQRKPFAEWVKERWAGFGGTTQAVAKGGAIEAPKAVWEKLKPGEASATGWFAQTKGRRGVRTVGRGLQYGAAGLATGLTGAATATGGGLAAGVIGAGSAIGRGAATVGGAIGYGTRYAGGKTIEGAQYVGGKTVEGAQYAGGKIAEGARYTRGKIVEGAEYAGGKIAAGAKYTRGQIAAGGRWAGKKLGEAKTYVGKKLGEAKESIGKKLGEAKEAIGEKLGEAKAYIGGKISAGAQKIRNVYVGIQDDVTPVPAKPEAKKSLAGVRDQAGELYTAVFQHHHQTQRNLAFLQEDEFVLKRSEPELQKQIQTLSQPGHHPRLKFWKNKDDYQAQLDKVRAEIPKATDRVAQALAATTKIDGYLQSITQFYLGAKTDAGEKDPQQASLKLGVVSPRLDQAQTEEIDAVAERNRIAHLHNDVRRSGRGDRLAKSVLKTAVAKGLGAGLGIATAGILGVDQKQRGGEYSSTLRVTNGWTRWKDELDRLTVIRKSALYGNRVASTLYASLKGISTLVLAPIRNFISWLALVIGLIGTALTGVLVTVPVGATFVGLGAFLTGLAVKLTIVNAGINALLLIWNIVRQILLKNEMKRAALSRETVQSAATVLTEGVAIGSSAAGSAIKAAADPAAAQQLFQFKTPGELSSIATAKVPLPVTVGAMGASVGGPIGGGIAGSLIESKPSTLGKMYQEATAKPHESNVMRGAQARHGRKGKRFGEWLGSKFSRNKASADQSLKDVLPEAMKRASSTEGDLSGFANLSSGAATKISGARSRWQAIKDKFSRSGPDEAQKKKEAESNDQSLQVGESVLQKTVDLFSGGRDVVHDSAADLAKRAQEEESSKS